MSNEGLPELADNLSKLGDNVQSLQDKYANQGLKQLSEQLSKVVTQLKDVAQSLDKAKVEVSSGLQKTIDNLKQSIDNIDFSPEVNVNAPPTKVVTTPVDFKPVISALENVEKAVSSQEIPDNQIDLEPVTSGLKEVVETINAIRFPVPNYESPFRNSQGKSTQVQLNDDGTLPTAAGGSGGTQYAEDSAHVSGDLVNMAGVVQQTADASLSGDGDRSLLQVDSSGFLKVNIKAGAGSGGTAMTDDAAFTPATTNITPAGAMFDDVAPDSVDEGDGGVLRMSANRNLYSTLRDAAGNERGANVNASNELKVNATQSGTWNIGTVTPGTAATNLGKAEDAAHASGDTGVMLLAVREATATDLSVGATDGDYEPLQVGATGRLWVSATVDAALPAGTNAIGKLAANDGVDIGDVTINNASLAVTGTFFQSTQPVSIASGATAIAKAEDVASADADVGVPAMAIRKATPANTSGTDGDYEMLQISGGKLWTTASIDQTTDGTTNKVAATQATASNLNAQVVGSVAHDGADSGNPEKMGGRARTSPWTGVANDDRTDAMYDIYGKQIVRESLREDLGNQMTTITSSTAETTIATADATYKLDVYSFILSNTSATATKVTIKDSTAGTSRFVFQVPAGDTRGFTVPPSGAHKQNAANNNWTATCGTSVADLVVTVMWTRSL